MYNPYISKKFIVNCISKEERLKLKKSLLGQTIRIIIDPQYGLLTEHGFPVAVATYGKFDVEFLCDDLCCTPRWFFPARDPEKPLKNTSVDRVFNRFWSATACSSMCNNKPTVHDLRFTFVTDRINLWTMGGTDLDVMMPYLQKYLGHKNLQDSYYYYHNSRMLYEAIRIKDMTAAQVIPEVTDYE